MLYTPVPGTPLFQRDGSAGPHAGRLDLADIHGQYKFNFQHPAISPDESKKLLDWAFRRDFERNGPSLYRICRTTFDGLERYRNYPDRRVRARFDAGGKEMRDGYAAALWAMERYLRRSNAEVSARVREVRVTWTGRFSRLRRA